MERETRKPPAIVPLLVIIGGGLVLVSYFFHWGRVAAVNGSGHRDLKGGTVVLVAGIVGILLGLGLWALSSRGARVAVSIVAIVGGLAAALIGGVGLSKDFIRNAVADQIGDETGIPHQTAENQLKQAEEAGTIKTTVQTGIYFALAGGVLVLIGGIGGLVTGRSGPGAPAPMGSGGDAAVPPPPPGVDTEPAPAPMPQQEPGSEPTPPPPPPPQSGTEGSPGAPPPEPPPQL